MSVVNITRSIRSTFDWQSGNLGWSDERRAAIFRRFWSNVKRADAKACWLWDGYRATHGYGVFAIGQQRVRAHRFAWMTSRGPIPAGQEVCHQCDQPACVNPGHLFLGTHRDNHLDSVRKGRKGCFGRQKLNAQQVIEIRALAANGILHRRIAADYGIAPHTVGGIVKRRSWAHVESVPAAN